ncbi:hypothetical protein PLICRDRAFT_702445, partial [Plicaturopsis crispa FD-325 SS-3]
MRKAKAGSHPGLRAHEESVAILLQPSKCPQLSFNRFSIHQPDMTDRDGSVHGVYYTPNGLRHRLQMRQPNRNPGHAGLRQPSIASQDLSQRVFVMSPRGCDSGHPRPWAPCHTSRGLTIRCRHKHADRCSSRSCEQRNSHLVHFPARVLRFRRLWIQIGRTTSRQRGWATILSCLSVCIVVVMDCNA